MKQSLKLLQVVCGHSSAISADKTFAVRVLYEEIRYFIFSELEWVEEADDPLKKLLSDKAEFFKKIEGTNRFYFFSFLACEGCRTFEPQNL